MIPSGLATPLATPGGNPEESRAVTKWRRRESNPGPKTPCSCLYVCSRRTVSPRVAPVGGLSSALGPCLIFASRPVPRHSASQLADALPEALAGLPVGRISDLLFRQREQLRYRSQLYLPERIYVDLGPPRHAAKSLESPSKPIAPETGGSEALIAYGRQRPSQGGPSSGLLWTDPRVVRSQRQISIRRFWLHEPAR